MIMYAFCFGTIVFTEFRDSIFGWHLFVPPQWQDVTQGQLNVGFYTNRPRTEIVILVSVVTITISLYCNKASAAKRLELLSTHREQLNRYYTLIINLPTSPLHTQTDVLSRERIFMVFTLIFKLAYHSLEEGNTYCNQICLS